MHLPPSLTLFLLVLSTNISSKKCRQSTQKRVLHDITRRYDIKYRIVAGRPISSILCIYFEVENLILTVSIEEDLSEFTSDGQPD